MVNYDVDVLSPTPTLSKTALLMRVTRSRTVSSVYLGGIMDAGRYLQHHMGIDGLCWVMAGTWLHHVSQGHITQGHKRHWLCVTYSGSQSAAISRLKAAAATSRAWNSCIFNSMKLWGHCCMHCIHDCLHDGIWQTCSNINLLCTLTSLKSSRDCTRTSLEEASLRVCMHICSVDSIIRLQCKGAELHAICIWGFA